MVYTNNVPKGHMRSPAKPQVVFAVESHTALIARAMGLDPYEFRRINLLRDGDSSPVGHRWREIRAEETLRRAADAAGWGGAKPAAVQPGALTGRGLAITDLAQGVGRFAARVSIGAAGRPTLHMAFWDTGTGSHTVLRQMVAQELSVPVDEVDIELLDTSAMPFSSGSGGTRVTYTAGQAVVGAARELRRRLIRAAAPLLDSPEADVSLQSGRIVVGPSPLRPAYYRTITLGEAAAHAGAGGIVAECEVESAPPDVTSFCAQAAEVEIDPETGAITVTRFVTAHDVGNILNPLMHQGQVEGGVIQGLGYALMEELHAEDGRIANLSLGDYKIPTIADIPPLTTALVGGAGGPRTLPQQGHRRKRQHSGSRGHRQRGHRCHRGADNRPAADRGKGAAGPPGARTGQLIWLGMRQRIPPLQLSLQIIHPVIGNNPGPLQATYDDARGDALLFGKPPDFRRIAPEGVSELIPLGAGDQEILRPNIGVQLRLAFRRIITGRLGSDGVNKHPRFIFRQDVRHFVKQAEPQMIVFQIPGA